MAESYTLANGDVVFILPRGGELFPQLLTRVDADALVRLEQCAKRWPLENGDIQAELDVSIFQNPGTVHWLVCETAFFHSMPADSAAYALPNDIRAQGFRKYGSNGIFHQWVAEQFPAEEKIVSVCLNDSPSTAAIINRSPIDTSGGYSLLDGLAGRSTCGSIDPSIVLLMADAGCSVNEIEIALYRNSGWQAIINEDSSLMYLLRQSHGEFAEAQELLLQEILKAIGAMLASRGGADRIVIGCEDYGSGMSFANQLQARVSMITTQFSYLEFKYEEIVQSIIRQNIGIKLPLPRI